ncbi:MAG: phosphatidate cytidylyltransferase [Robiginitomaculum sp.]|nr:MAG: phosphatidate cytidylyltransferase [Robiginitomaculum sp.]
MSDVKTSKLKTLGIRAASGLVLAAICGLPLYYGGWVLTAFILIVSTRVIYEWVRMSDPGAGKLAFILPIVCLFTVLGLAQYGLWQQTWSYILPFALFAYLEKQRRTGQSAAVWAGLGVLYVLLPSLAILWLRGDEVGVSADGFAKFIFIVIVVIAADSWAYLGGSTIGGPKLIPKVSPNKTWSGLISGFVFGSLFGALAAWIIGFSPIYGALLAVPVVVFAVLGDLLESVIKRYLNVKDSGGIIPGHGGLLDRIDSLMLIVVVAAALLLIWPNIWPMVGA